MRTRQTGVVNWSQIRMPFAGCKENFGIVEDLGLPNESGAVRKRDRRRLLLIVLADSNITLAAALVLSRRRPVGPSAESGDNTQANDTNHVKTQVVLRKQFFSWQEVEAADYRAYITNLRDIGCPEQTIRDIIIADVNQLYAKKRLKEVVTPEQQWWRSVPDPNVVAAAKAKIQSLERERRDLLNTLLGPGWDENDPATASSTVALDGPLLGDLPPEVKQSVREISLLSQQRTQDYLEAQAREGKPPDPAVLAQLRQETRDERGQVLDPAQLEEFLLRYSQTAGNLRNQLNGFEKSAPDEFRTLFRASDSINEQLQLVTGDDPAVIAQRTALEKQLEAAIKTTLGPDRYQNYLAAQDPAYRDALALAQQSGAPLETIQSLQELYQATQLEQDRIRNDPSLTAEQKADQLKALDQEQKTARDELLGLTAPASTTPPQPPLPPGLTPGQIHTFSPGETVNQIAAQYGVSATSIFNANPDLDFNNLLPAGAPIKIPQHP